MSESIAPRNPWLAALLSAAASGLGVLYAGHPRLGVLCSVARWIPMLLLMVIGTLLGVNIFIPVVMGLAIYWGVYLAQLPLAFVLARRAPRDYVPKRFNRLGVYLGFWVGMLLLGVLSAFTARVAVVEAFKIPSNSLQPTARQGDQIFVAKLGPKASERDYGTLVTFIAPTPPFDTYIKRIVAKGGDEVAFRDGAVYVNGKAFARGDCDEPSYTYRDYHDGSYETLTARCHTETSHDGKTYRVLSDPSSAASDYGPTVVAEGHFFVVGDNRDNSYDSRHWGPVPAENIFGVPTIIWWSWGAEGLRPERLGEVL